MKRFVLPLMIVTVLVLSACAPAMQQQPAATEAMAEATAAPAAEAAPVADAAKDIVDTAVEAGSFGTLVAAVQAAGLVDTLKGAGPFTVFAPTDEAFAALPEGTVDALLADPAGDLTQILLYHVVPGNVLAADVSDGLEADTAQGGKVKFTVADGQVMINDAKIVATDIIASNGVIHVIDKVILPEVGESSMPAAPVAAGTIPEVAAAAGSFNTLLAAVTAAGLAETLSGEGPFTVFAPTDAAFAALPEGTVDALLADPTGDLAQILLYHVVPGKVMAADLSDGLEAATAQGANVTFSLADGKAMVNGANIVAADVEASNGVIHVIDAVILPPAE